MNDEELFKILEEICKAINKELSNNSDSIVLDKKLFNCKKKNEEIEEYSTKKEAIGIIKKVEVLFVADNPGENENIFMEFLYAPNPKEDPNYYLRAGYKFHNSIKKVPFLKDEEKIIVFNKCLISTKKTNGLTSDQVNKTKPFVEKFIKSLMDYNKELIIVFLGISSRKKYHVLNPVFELFKCNKNVYMLPHPVRNMFPTSIYGKNIDIKPDSITNVDEFIDYLTTVRNLLFNDEHNKDNKCVDDNDNDNGNDDGGDDGPSPCLVDA
ncbi:MAG: hypothetical protein K6F14_02645 [Clostridiales bacterium]|nr:hypothetical protein [Clostridiales bacterium]